MRFRKPDRSHKVHAHPWQIPADVESAVCELRRAHPKWGPKRLVFEMDRRGHGTVTRSTVYRVLVRNGLIEPKSRKRRRQDYKRWERPVAMQLWQLDVTASAFLADGREVKIVQQRDPPLQGLRSQNANRGPILNPCPIRARKLSHDQACTGRIRAGLLVQRRTAELLDLVAYRGSRRPGLRAD